MSIRADVGMRAGLYVVIGLVWERAVIWVELVLVFDVGLTNLFFLRRAVFGFFGLKGGLVDCFG